MPDYEELLRKAKKNLPASAEVSRFEIPKASVHVMGRQTYVKNFNEIAKALRRDPKHMAKFLFKELAVPGSLGGELILQGKFSSDIVNKRIADYAKEFVMCHECKKPDTNLSKVGRIVFLKCEACGARRSVKRV